MRDTHPRCKTCGEESGSTGSLTGLVHRWGPRDHPFEPEQPATHPCDTCGGTGEITEYGGSLTGPMRISIILCPVCLGAGSFPDRMPAADALADAETLRKQLPHAVALRVLFVVHSDDGIERYTTEAVSAARAAFRAVPGLRG